MYSSDKYLTSPICNVYETNVRFPETLKES